MEIKKGLHYVPEKSHLKNFSNTLGKVWVLDVVKKQIYPNPTNPKKIFKQKHFYRITLKSGEKSLLVEDTLADIEDAFGKIYLDKISKDQYLSNEEKAKAAIFVAAMYLRTRTYREGIKKAFKTLYEQAKIWKTMFENNPKAREFSALIQTKSP